MKSTLLITVSVVTTVSLAALLAADEPPQVAAWNEKASSAVLSAEGVGSLGGTRHEWRASQMIWPSKAEIEASSVEASPDLKSACVKVIREILKPSYIPAGVEDHLVAMNDWGKIFRPENQIKPVDVFIVRYTIGDSVIHIQDSPKKTTIAIADESLRTRADGDRARLFRDVWEKFIRSDIKSSWPAKTRHDATPELTVFSFFSGPHTVTGGETWLGAAFTDGGFVLLEFLKDDRSAVGIDPYKKLF